MSLSAGAEPKGSTDRFFKLVINIYCLSRELRENWIRLGLLLITSVHVPSYAELIQT